MLEIRAPRIPDLLDTIYSQPDDDAWMQRVLKATLAALVHTRCGVAYSFRALWQANVMRLTALERQHSYGMVGDWSRLNFERQEPAIPQLVERGFGRTFGGVASEAFGMPGKLLSSLPNWTNVWPATVFDSIGLVAREPSGHGVLVNIGKEDIDPLRNRDRRLLNKLTAHLGAGFRLRLQSKPICIDDSDAVISSNGTIVHAQNEAIAGRARLEDGRRRRDAARRSKHDPEQALEIWRGLVAGRWSLVDHFDTDGKRFILAIRNAPRVDQPANLTPLERRVCALAAMGQRDKEIAYILGLTMPSVVSALHRARTKQGWRSRSELAAAWRSGPSQ